MSRFELDERLGRDTIIAGDLSLCTVRLMDEARFDWLVMVPRRAEISEIFDLPPRLRQVLTEEIAGIASSLKEVTGATKINIAMFGNMVPQLHVHVIARHEGDAAWPGSAVGMPRKAMADEEIEEKLQRLAPVFRPGLNNGTPSALF